jgi:hypothetical protein
VDRPDEGDAAPELRPADVTDGPKLELPKGAGSSDGQPALTGDETDESFGELADPDKQGYKPMGGGADDSDPFDQTEAGEAELPIRKLVEKSLQETISETRKWIFETGLEKKTARRAAFPQRAGHFPS